MAVENGEVLLCKILNGNLYGIVPLMLDSLKGLSHGVWAFAVNPKEVSSQVIKSAQNLIYYLATTDFTTIADCAVPELKKLAKEFAFMSSSQSGELIGAIIGKYGVDYLLLKGSGKFLNLYRELREANAALTLHTIAKSTKKAEKVKTISDQWWKKTSPIVEEIKRSEGRIGQNLHKAFKNENLSEIQIRKIFHHAGVKTFPKPKGIPKNWNVKIADKHGGMRYICPKNNHFEVRVSPGFSNAEFHTQKKPYVIHRTDKGWLGKNGEIVKLESAEAHIPLNEYDFNKLLNKVPFHE